MFFVKLIIKPFVWMYGFVLGIVFGNDRAMEILEQNIITLDRLIVKLEAHRTK